MRSPREPRDRSADGPERPLRGVPCWRRCVAQRNDQRTRATGVCGGICPRSSAKTRLDKRSASACKFNVRWLALVFTVHSPAARPRTSAFHARRGSRTSAALPAGRGPACPAAESGSRSHGGRLGARALAQACRAAAQRKIDSCAQWAPCRRALVGASQGAAELDERTGVLEPRGRVGELGLGQLPRLRRVLRRESERERRAPLVLERVSDPLLALTARVIRRRRH